MFQIICKFKGSVPDAQFRDVIFNDIYERFDTSQEHWEKFNARKPELEKRLGYFEIESVDNPCHVVIAVNPKEYYEHFENFSCNKNHKGQKKALQT